MVAFSNSRGGKLIIGINDKSGVINALSYKELQETTNLLTSIASENVIPNILIDVDNAPASGGAVVVVTIPEGKNVSIRTNTPFKAFGLVVALRSRKQSNLNYYE